MNLLKKSRKGGAARPLRLLPSPRGPWFRGYDFMIRTDDRYSIRDCRIGAMAFEAGWKAALRSRRKK